MEVLRKVFNQFDKDMEGTISTNEIGNVLRELGQNPTFDEVKLMAESADADGDGTIDFDEFIALMGKGPKANIENKTDETDE